MLLAVKSRSRKIKAATMKIIQSAGVGNIGWRFAAGADGTEPTNDLSCGAACSSASQANTAENKMPIAASSPIGQRQSPVILYRQPA